jgi:hypothetical protein
MSLRSIEEHISNVDKIVIVGHKPEWLKDIYHIPCEDEHPCKETNIYKKILGACQDENVSEDFLFFNDDHFILQDFDANTFPYYYKGDLFFILKKLPPYNKYSTCVHRTGHTLKNLGLGTKNFDTHTPIIYNKEKFKSIMPQYDWSERFSYVVKSLYANSLGIEGVREPDCKIADSPSLEEFKNRIRERKVFSIDNAAINDSLHQLFKELYPNPSRWES